MMVSVAAAGYAGPELAASASGLAGLFGYIGATVAGAGVGVSAGVGARVRPLRDAK